MKTIHKEKNILHVTHCWGGGIPVYIADIREILNSDFNIFVLKCCDGRIELEYGKNNAKKTYYNLSAPLTLTDYYNSEYREIVTKILKAFEINLIHINITLGHTFDIFDIAKDIGVPIIYTVHDYFYVCPTFHMIDRNGKYCKGCDNDSISEECLKNHPYINNPKFDKIMLKKWRSEFSRVKDLIDLFIFPSYSCKNVFLSYYEILEKKCRVIYHGTSFDKKKALLKKKKDLRVGILGSMLKHKGESLFKFILENIDDYRIKFFHFGEGFLESRNLINYGAYDRPMIVRLLRDNEIDVVLLLSTWPETFSYTLTETIAAGIPPIVTNLGSLKERVEKSNIGWVVDYEDPEKICELLRSIRTNSSELEKRCKRIDTLPLKSMIEMKSEYVDVYNYVLSEIKNYAIDHKEKITARLQLESIENKVTKKTLKDIAEKAPLETFLKSFNRY